MKKFLALFLALLMVVSLVACGDNGDSSNDGSNSDTSGDVSGDTSGDVSTEQPPVEGEALPASPLYYWGFEDATGLTAVYQAANTEDPNLTGATYALSPSVHEIMIAEGKGVSGNALYLDGKYGVKLDDMGAVSDDTYTISFWYAASRFSQFGAIVAMGRNVGMNDAENTVTWVSFTKADTWSVEASDAAPVAWNRNSTENVWPWIGANDGVHGRKEWCHVVLVVDGTSYKDDTGLPHIAARFYVDGELMMEATAANTADTWMGIAPEILTGDGIYGVEGLIGINYWDTVFKGYVDELYVYDEALTPGQVKTLYELGTPSGDYEDLTYDGPLDGDSTDVGGETTEPEVLPAAPVDDSAIDTLGTPERVLGWWSDNTDGFELADGATLTLKLNNYSDGKNNWDNFVIGLTNTAVTTDLLASADNYAGYAEYAVIRADAYGWGDEAYAGNFETSWTDWASWLNLMTDAEVEIVLTRAGGEVTINYTFTGADGTVMTESAVVTSTMTAESPVYVFLGGEGAYIELLSVE